LIKVLTIFGTRPEAIKMAPLVRELARHPAHIVSRVCVTAQHREMLDQVLSLFAIEPHYDLDVMRERQRLAGVMARILVGIERVIEQEQPDWVLVQGDTTTTVAAALAAFYGRCKVGHVEAGLRTGDKLQPYPEEINRRITDTVSDLYFVPTEANRRNLLAEGFDRDAVLVTGNTVIDALLQVSAMEYDLDSGPLSCVPPGRRIVLVTAHRRENFGTPLRSVCRALLELEELYRNDVQIVYPVHRNPNVQTVVREMLDGHPGISLLDPLGYQDFVQLMGRCHVILTDSGGLQEEAPSLGKPALVLREVTERPEAVEAGAVRIVGTDAGTIVRETGRLLDDPDQYRRMSAVANPYGDGQASRRIVRAILARAGTTDRRIDHAVHRVASVQ
jgi:UDP-N-acetylglucosamine 2-epimerase (non-hydrolysing)